MIPRSIQPAIARVVDPCANAIGMPVDIGDLGLINDATVDTEAGDVKVTLCLTSPCCTYGPAIAGALRAELLRLSWVNRATVEIDYAVMWTPDRLTTRGRSRQEARRARTRDLLAVTPYEW